MIRYFFRFLMAFVLTATAGVVAWRKLASVRSLPFPPGFSFLLETPFMDKVASSDTILKRSGIKEGMSVADIGCGTGRLTIPAAQAVGTSGRVVALDIQKEMLQQVKEKIFDNDLENVALRHGGAGEGFLEKDSFDRIYMVGVFGEISDQLAALKEANDALKKGGMLSITEILPGPLYQAKLKTQRLCAEVGLEYYQYFENNFAYTLQFLKK